MSPHEEIVCLTGLKTTFATAYAGLDFTAGASYGAGGTASFALPVTGSPDFALNTEIDQTKAMTGLRENYQYFDDGELLRYNPTTTIEYPGGAYTTAVPLAALFQRQFTEGAATPFTKIWAASLDGATSTEPYDPFFFMSVMKYYTTGANAVNEIMDGCVTNSASFSCEGGPLMVSVGITGARYRTGINLTTPSVGLQSTNPPLVFQNMVCDLVDSAGASQFICKGFTINITSGVEVGFYNNALPQKIVMGLLKCEGTLKIPHAQRAVETGTGTGYEGGIRPILDYFGLVSGVSTVSFDGDATAIGTAQTNRALRIYWGHPTDTSAVAGDLSFVMNILMGEPKRTADAELMYEIPFRTTRTAAGLDGLTVYNSNAVDYTL